MINQANRRPGHASYPSAIRSKPFAPVFTYEKEPRYPLSRYSTRLYARGPAIVCQSRTLGCMTAVARPPQRPAGPSSSDGCSKRRRKGTDKSGFRPSAGHFALWASSMEDVQGTPERNAGSAASCCWRKAINARRPSRSDASYPGGGFRIGPSLPSVPASHSTGPVAETVMHPAPHPPPIPA